MKKLIAILMVLAIVAGSAFADKTSETHNVNIKADVTEVIPAFKLVVGDTSTATNTPETGDPNKFDNAQTSYTVEYGDVGFNLDVGGSVTVYAKLANLPKQVQGYSLTFSDGVFSVNRNKAAGFLSPSSVAVTMGNNDTGIINMDGGGTITIDSPNQTGGTKPTVTGTAVTFALNGTTVTTNNATLATAVYTYTGDTSIDPIASGTYYEATITLTVAAV